MLRRRNEQLALFPLVRWLHALALGLCHALDLMLDASCLSRGERWHSNGEIQAFDRTTSKPSSVSTWMVLTAYPNNPAARKAIKAQAKCSKAM